MQCDAAAVDGDGWGFAARPDNERVDIAGNASPVMPDAHVCPLGRLLAVPFTVQLVGPRHLNCQDIKRSLKILQFSFFMLSALIAAEIKRVWDS